MRQSRCHTMRNILFLGGVLMMLAACEHYLPGGTATPPAFLTKTKCTGTYAADHYTVQCPAGWTVTSAPNLPEMLVFASPDQRTGMIISSPVGSFTASQYGELLQQYMSVANVANISVIVSGKTTTAGPGGWTPAATATGNKGATRYTYRQFVRYHDGKRYMAILYAPTASSAASENSLLAMLASLHFE